MKMAFSTQALNLHINVSFCITFVWLTRHI